MKKLSGYLFGFMFLLVAVMISGCGGGGGSIVSAAPTTAGTSAPEGYDYSLVSQSPYSANMEVGETATVTVEVKNTGSQTWTNTGANKITLGTGSTYGTGHQSYGYMSEVYNSSWISEGTVVTISDSSVAPNATTTFVFVIRMPTTTGIVKAYFTPMVGNVPMKDIGFYYQINVTPLASAVKHIVPVTSPSAIVATGSSITVSVRTTGRCCGGMVSDGAFIGSAPVTFKLFDGSTLIGAIVKVIADQNALATTNFSLADIAVAPGSTKHLIIKATVEDSAFVDSGDPIPEYDFAFDVQ